MGGALSPGILAQLGDRIVHLVHIAAVAADEGELPLATASLEFVAQLLADADGLRTALHGATLADGTGPLPFGLRSTDDRGALARIDSLNLGCVPTSWAGAPAAIPLDVGHNVARTAPGGLAGVLGEIAGRYEGGR